jgi:hypothetical protein
VLIAATPCASVPREEIIVVAIVISVKLVHHHTNGCKIVAGLTLKVALVQRSGQLLASRANSRV